MAELRCPVCGQPNPAGTKTCQFCGTSLNLPAASSAAAAPLRPGDEPVKKNTAEFEKVNLPSSQKQTIHPGEEPTKKNTAELERALPSWLRALRDKSDVSPTEPAAPPTKESQTSAPEESPAPPPLGPVPEWLSGLGSAAAGEQEIPDWLSSLRSKGGMEADEPAAPSAPDQDAKQDTRATPGGKPQPAPVQPPPAPQPPPANEEGLPVWLQNLQNEGSKLVEETPGPPPDNQDVSDWLSKLPPAPSEAQATPAEELPDWLKKLKDQTTPAEGEATPPSASTAELTPEWLARLQAEAETQTEAASAAAAKQEEIPEWLSKLETKAGTGVTAPAAPAFSEAPPVSPAELTGPPPDWLSKLQAGIAAASEAEEKKQEFEVAPQPPPESPPSEPLPDWLSGIQPTTPPPGETPALIIAREDQMPPSAGEAAFSMETPDWLSKLKPEQAREEQPQAAPGTPEEGQPPESLEPGELPSWVQAMRPVEAVVAEAKAAPPAESPVAEQNGPLAGLSGVLPAVPGMGPLRKPPAYATKLQASEAQQRYADSLEKLVHAETIPQPAPSTLRISSHLLRWLLVLLLFVAVGAPIVTGVQVVPTATLPPVEEVQATYTLIAQLPPNSPVLVVFDYEPALSGELEAAEENVVGQLVTAHALLTLISTSPTGPALAEHFLQTTLPGAKLQSGQAYVNLGYLAGGPTGILDFASWPSKAAPFAWSTDPKVDGYNAWAMPPLQGVVAISDFKAIFVLTDSADTGRNWIEQAGPFLGGTPMLMVISAQAEPMMRPYFDSGQLKGLVTGLAGGKAYEQSVQHPGLGQAYWNPFSTGLLMAEISLLVGGIWSAVLAWRERKRLEEA
jgi:hypothetical protein